MEPREHQPLTADVLGAWVPWSRRLNDILDTVRTIATSNVANDDDGPHHREQVAALGVRAHVLMDQIRTQPALPGRFGDAVEVLRSPTNAEPARLAAALALLGSIADLAQPEPPNTTTGSGRARRGGSQRATRCPQSSLPGLEPTPTIEGANQ